MLALALLFLLPTKPLEAGNLAAPTAESTRRKYRIDDYLSKSRGTPAFYQTAPLTHVAPAARTVIFAINARKIETDVVDEQYSQTRDKANDQLFLRGYSVAPHVAFSVKGSGLGFNAEAGRTQMDYRMSTLQTFAYAGIPSEQVSSVDYRGVGVFGFYNLIEKGVLRATVIGGLKNTQVSHRIGTLQSFSNVPTGLVATDYLGNYTLTGYSAGLNVGIKLIKSFTINPWADYSYTDVGPAKQQASITSDDVKSYYLEDIEVFWRSKPSLNYGLDLVAKAYNFEIHFGGLFGTLVASGNTPSATRDGGYSTSVTLTFKK